jgi:hypothetical protein
MKILEILLPKNVKDKDISPKHVQRIDLLQKRMDTYVDKIGDPATSSKGREFLKSKLKDDYDELRSVIKTAIDEHIVKHGSGYRLLSHKGKNLGTFSSKKDAAKHEGEVEYFKSHPKESTEVPTQETYEVYDTKTGQKVGGPYTSTSRARSAVDRLDNKYGGYRYKYRPVTKLNEAIRKLPLSNEDFELVQTIMNRPIPAAIAPIYIQEIIDDDEFNDQLLELENSNPGLDVRPLVVEWFRRVMPDQMFRFTDEHQTTRQKLGTLSPIHGYDPHMYKGSNDPITGDAYGSR